MVNKESDKTKSKVICRLGGSTSFWAMLVCGSLVPIAANAFTYTFDNGTEIRFDNNVEYSLYQRLSPTLPALANSVNGNDGDLNLKAGIVSNRIQDITTFDISKDGFGFDASAESFYDSVYLSKTQNGSPATYNAIGPSSKYPGAGGPVPVLGRNIEYRNLFGYGTTTIAGIPVTVRVGRHTLVWGESLFFPDNGVAYGIAPIDAAEATSEPNTEAQYLFLPVGMASLSAQLTDAVQFEAYYQFEWERTILPPVGSYFSPEDVAGGGAQRIVLATPIPGVFPGEYFYRGRDISGSDTGQFGIALHYSPPTENYVLGFYALQFNDRSPQVYVYPGVGAGPTSSGISAGTYRQVYPDHIQLYGASASTTFGPWNIAGEVSWRHNMPLYNTGVTVLPGQNANNTNHPLYPTGDVAYAQASVIYLGPATRFFSTSSLVGELAGNQLADVLKNGDNFTRAQGTGPGHWTALGFHTVYTPTWYEVRPGFDLSMPVGFAYNFMGKSSSTASFNGTDQQHGGLVTIGLNVTYLQAWNADLGYTRYIGTVSNGQTSADRDYASFSLQHIF